MSYYVTGSFGSKVKELRDARVALETSKTSNTLQDIQAIALSTANTLADCIAGLNTANSEIRVDINKLKIAPTASETPAQKQAREERLKKLEDTSKKIAGDLANFSTRLTAITTDAAIAPLIQGTPTTGYTAPATPLEDPSALASSPTKDLLRDAIKDTKKTVEKNYSESWKTSRGNEFRVDLEKLDTIAPLAQKINLLSSQNEVAKRFTTDLSAYIKSFTALADIMKKAVTPESHKLYHDDIARAHKEGMQARERLESQLKDEDTRKKILQTAKQEDLSATAAADAAGLAAKTAAITAALAGATRAPTPAEQTQADTASNNAHRTALQTRPNNNEQNVVDCVNKIFEKEDYKLNSGKVGQIDSAKNTKESGFTYRQPEKKDYSGKVTAKAKTVALLDAQGDQIKFSRAEMSDLVSKKNAEDLAAWQKADRGKHERSFLDKILNRDKKFEPIKFIDRSNGRYTISCHTDERREDFFKTMKTAWDDKLKAKAPAAPTAVTHANAPATAPAPSTAPAPTASGTTSTTPIVAAIPTPAPAQEPATRRDAEIAHGELKNMINGDAKHEEICAKLDTPAAQAMNSAECDSLLDKIRDKFSSLLSDSAKEKERLKDDKVEANGTTSQSPETKLTNMKSEKEKEEVLSGIMAPAKPTEEPTAPTA